MRHILNLCDKTLIKKNIYIISAALLLAINMQSNTALLTSFEVIPVPNWWTDDVDNFQCLVKSMWTSWAIHWRSGQVCKCPVAWSSSLKKKLRTSALGTFHSPSQHLYTDESWKYVYHLDFTYHCPLHCLLSKPNSLLYQNCHQAHVTSD